MFAGLIKMFITSKKYLTNEIKYDIIYNVNQICGYGVIGRHDRLKICWASARAGSSPATRTNADIITLQPREWICQLNYHRLR